jgi:hypothetical protein
VGRVVVASPVEVVVVVFADVDGPPPEPPHPGATSARTAIDPASAVALHLRVRTVEAP